jgi:hypothetical protein
MNAPSTLSSRHPAAAPASTQQSVALKESASNNRRIFFLLATTEGLESPEPRAGSARSIDVMDFVFYYEGLSTFSTMKFTKQRTRPPPTDRRLANCEPGSIQSTPAASSGAVVGLSNGSRTPRVVAIARTNGAMCFTLLNLCRTVEPIEKSEARMKLHSLLSFHDRMRTTYS